MSGGYRAGMSGGHSAAGGSSSSSSSIIIIIRISRGGWLVLFSVGSMRPGSGEDESRGQDRCYRVVVSGGQETREQEES